MKFVLRYIRKAFHNFSEIKSKSIIFITGIYLSFVMSSARADTDLLADPAKDLFKTFCGTGINLLLLIEICAGIYLFSTSRKMAAFVGIPLLLAITAWAKVKFGGTA